MDKAMSKNIEELEEVERICAYCEYATVLSNAEVCLCKKRGAVRPDGGCRKFRVDLLKIDPKPRPLPEAPDRYDPNESEDVVSDSDAGNQG